MLERTRNYRLALSAVFLVALSLRVIHVISMMHGDLQFDVPTLDARWHDEWAQEIASGKLFDEGVYFRAPLYPMFLGLIYSLFGHSHLAGKLALSFLGAIGCVLTALIAAKCFSDRKLGILAGFLLAVCGTAIYFDGELLIEGFSSFLNLTGLLMLIWAAHKKRPELILLAGIIFGLSSIARPNALITLPVLIWFVAHGDKRFVKALVLIVGVAIPIMPITVKNYVKGNDLVLISSQGGINFYIGNNPESDGKTSVAPGHYGISTDTGPYTDNVRVSAKVVAEQETGKILKPSEVSRFWSGKAMAFITDSPVEWAALTLKKTYFFFNAFEIPSNRDIYGAIKHSPVVSALTTKGVLAIPMGIILPLGILGMLMALLSENRSRITWLLAMFALFYSVSIIMFFVTARFRVPIIPILVIFSARALFSVVESVRESPGIKPVALIVLLIAACVISNSRAFGVREFQAREFHISAGKVFYVKGRYEEAITEFNKALAIDPDNFVAHLDLGTTLMKMKMPIEAEKHLKEAIKLRPDHSLAYMNLGNLYLRYKKHGFSMEYHLKAVELDPENAIARFNLAYDYYETGQYDLARQELQKVIDLDRNFKQAHDLMKKLQ